MKKLFYYIPLFILFTIILSCVKKELDLNVQQSVCKRVKIKEPSYRLIEDACTSGTKISFEVKFTFKGDEECLNSIENSPVFYTETNEEINPLSFESASVSKTLFTVTGNEITYLFTVHFSNENQAKTLNHIVLDFYTKNELEDKSNTLQIRMNTSCSKVDRSTYDVNPNDVDIPSTDPTFTIQLWDNAAEDGDIVSVYLNGTWIIENFILLNNTTNFTFSTSILNPGINDLVVFALNEGSSGPNTVSIAINGDEIENFSPGLLTGEAVEINF